MQDEEIAVKNNQSLMSANAIDHDESHRDVYGDALRAMYIYS